MRVDASNLLNRLGRNDYSYKEFEDRFSELELWPILEALLKDPRLQELDSDLGQGQAKPAPEPAASAPEAPQIPPKTKPASEMSEANESIGALFRRYETASEPAPGTEADARSSGQDVRAMLRHLSELGARGEI